MTWSERIRTLSFWRWRRRLKCHGDIQPCQYIDRPMDNAPGRWS